MANLPRCPLCGKPMKKYVVKRSDYLGGSLDTTCFSHKTSGSGSTTEYSIWECDCGGVKL